jgi:hypothetical protein
LKWFLLASAQGQADAVKRAARLKDSMTGEEIIEAKKRVSAFVPKPGLKP